MLKSDVQTTTVLSKKDIDRESCEAPSISSRQADIQACIDSDSCTWNPTEGEAGWLPKDSRTYSSGARVVTQGNPGRKDANGFLQSGQIELYLSEQGGGSINHFESRSGKNLLAVGFDLAMQSSLSDEFHLNRWHAAQAGAAWGLGSPTSLTQSGNRVIIDRFNMPVKIADYDFLENDEITKNAGFGFVTIQHNGTDKDDCRERSADDELRSEFDFSGEVEDISGDLDSGVSGIRILNLMEYAGDPQSVLQFNEKLDLRAAMRLSPSLYPSATSETTDLSLAKHNWSMNLRNLDEYKSIHFSLGGRLLEQEVGSADSKMRKAHKVFLKGPNRAHIESQFESGKISLLQAPIARARNFIIIEKKNGEVIGIAYPEDSKTNTLQTVGVSNNQLLYAENRLLVANFEVTPTQGPKSDYLNVSLNVWTNGLLDPRSTTQGAVEGVRSEVYVFHGSKEEVLTAIKGLN